MPDDPKFRKFLPLHPERKLLTGCRHERTTPIFWHGSPPMYYISSRVSDFFGAPIVADMCVACFEWVENPRVAWLRPAIGDGFQWLMNPGA